MNKKSPANAGLFILGFGSAVNPTQADTNGVTR